MDLQQIFYGVSIAFMMGWLVFILILIGASLYIIKTIRQMKVTINKKMESKAFSMLFGLAPVAPLILGKLVSLFRSNRKG
jgi:hypothetical protein